MASRRSRIPCLDHLKGNARDHPLEPPGCNQPDSSRHHEPAGRGKRRPRPPPSTCPDPGAAGGAGDGNAVLNFVHQAPRRQSRSPAWRQQSPSWHRPTSPVQQAPRCWFAWWRASLSPSTSARKPANTGEADKPKLRSNSGPRDGPPGTDGADAGRDRRSADPGQRQGAILRQATPNGWVNAEDIGREVWPRHPPVLEHKSA